MSFLSEHHFHQLLTYRWRAKQWRFHFFIKIFPNQRENIFPLFTYQVLVGRKTTGFLHHNQILDVIIEKSDYDIKNLIVMKEARGFWSAKLECRQGDCST